jgi:guanylate kinase
MPGQVIVISGSSGVGKGTIVSRLAASNDYWVSISTTTRPKRIGEEEGVHYRFVDRPEFERLITEHYFLEWELVYGHFYGTPGQPLQDAYRNGMKVVLEIDTKGALTVKRKMPDAVLIFILPPTIDDQMKRLRQRGQDDDETIRQRMKSFFDELEDIQYFDYAVVNDVVDDAVARIADIVSSVEWRVAKQDGIIGRLKDEYVRLFDEVKNG